MQSLILATFLTLQPCASQPHERLAYLTDAAEAAASTYDVKPLLVASIIEHESACDPNAVSFVGLDIGLMQVRLKTAKTIDPSLTRRDLFDPYVSTLVGTAYLKQQINKCGSISRGLGAYSSGHCQVNAYSRRIMKTYFKLKKRYGLWKTA